MMKLRLTILTFLFTAMPGLFQAQEFEPVDLLLPGLSSGKASWVDLNGDNQLDLFAFGTNDLLEPVTMIYLNLGEGSFRRLETSIPHVQNGSSSWSDYDLDGDLDLLLSGAGTTGENTNVITGIFRNDLPAGFTRLATELTQVHSGSASWVDVDNNGTKDIYITGKTSGGEAVTRFFINNGFSFVETIAPFPAVFHSTAEWNDFDNDGDLDLLLSGQRNENTESYFTAIYRNTNGYFEELPFEFPPMSKGSAAWGDFDSDGNADIVINGEMNSENFQGVTSKVIIYHNDGDGTFTEHEAGIPGLSFGKIIWGDFDNDGLLDLLATGNMEGNENGMTRMFRNTGSGFIEVQNNLPPMLNGTLSAGDFDNDRKLDILMLGHSSSASTNKTLIFRNLVAAANDLPVEPKGLTTTFDNNVIHFNWLNGFDPNTQQEGLSYNIRIGTSPGSDDVLAPDAYGIAGSNRLPGLGNAGYSHTIHITGLDTGTYYWSVQTVDNSFGTSEFTADETFTIATNPQNQPSFVLSDFQLQQNFPNPFNPVTMISYELSKAGAVKLKVYDSRGTEVITLVNENKRGGNHSVEFDATNLPTGTYFYSLEVDGVRVDAKRMILLK